MNHLETSSCDGWHRMNRRRLLGLSAAAVGVSGWTTVAEQLARASEKEPNGKKAKSIILLWMAGGPSQLETFDPHAGKKIGGDTKVIKTTIPGLEISDFLPLTAERMHHTSLIRSMVSKEGDHERATYNIKNGWRPDPTLVHPSIGSILCHQTSDNLEIPRHVSILTGQWPARGGYLGADYDSFKIGDPRDPLPNLKSYMEDERQNRRTRGLQEVVERSFAKGRIRDLDRNKTLHETSTGRALKMMESSQIDAFDIKKESTNTTAKFGDTPFGRGCLAAVRLIETGVRCVEIELGSWDTHANNHEFTRGLCGTLDPALASLFDELEARNLLDSTLVLCGGEFGRTPSINPAGGRDHWPTGFSMLVAGGGLRTGQVIGATSPEPTEDPEKRLENIERPVRVEDLHATILKAAGVDYTLEMKTPIGRPLVLSQGTPVEELLG